MSYLKLRRGQIILACFLMTSLLLSAHPEIDIHVSRMFFDGGFHARDRWWHTLVHEGMVYFLCVSMASVVGLYAFNKWSNRTVGSIDGKKVCYLFVILIVGAGLIVNVILKDNFGRARPRDVEEFGGSKRFTPAFVISNECDDNCSFSSGEGAGGFFSLALAFALSRRRAMLVTSAALGSVVSVTRIASGAHFFSDTVVSFFVMLILSDLLYHYILLPKREREASLVPSLQAGNLEPSKEAA